MCLTLVSPRCPAPRAGEIAVRDGRISAVGAAGAVRGTGTTEIDAEGKLVTPGWVDVHSVSCADLPLPAASCPWLQLTQATLAQHYDGQATWDPYITPTSYHGVTTTIFGNCGVGFAPIKPGQEPWLINLMEGVEDIPGSVTGMHNCPAPSDLHAILMSACGAGPRGRHSLAPARHDHRWNVGDIP